MFKLKDVFGKAQDFIQQQKENKNIQGYVQNFLGSNQENQNKRIIPEETTTPMESEFDSNAKKTDPKMYYIIGGVVLLIIIFRKKLGIKF